MKIGDAPGFSEKAISCLYPLIKNDVELLPLEFDEKKIMVVNVITILDALDYEKSACVRFSSGKIMLIEKYSFLKSIVDNKHIFKLSDEKTKAAFVSETFKSVVEYNNLEGFKFELAWDEE